MGCFGSKLGGNGNDDFGIEVIQQKKTKNDADLSLSETQLKDLDVLLTRAYDANQWNMEFRCLVCQNIPWKPVNLGSNRVVCADCLSLVAGKDVMGFKFPVGKSYNPAEVEEYEKKLEKIRTTADVQLRESLHADAPCITMDYKDLPNAARNEEVAGLTIGLWGQVFVGKLNDGKSVVAKYVACELEERDYQSFHDHVQLLTKIKHKGIAHFIGAATSSPEHFVLVYKYYSNGSIEDFLYRHHHRFSLPHLICTLNDIAKAMHFLHCNNIYHGDLKPSNVLLSRNFDTKLIDFGLHDIKRRARKTGGVLGNAQYMSPERLQCQKHDPRFDDVYAYGILACELLTGELPFHGMASHEAITTAVFFRQRPSLPSTCVPLIAKLIRECWSADAKDRPSFFTISRKIIPIIRAQCVGETYNSPLPATAMTAGVSSSVSTSDVTVEENAPKINRDIRPTVIRSPVDMQSGLPIDQQLRFAANLYIDEYVTYRVYVDISIYGIVYYDAVTKKQQGGHSWAHISEFNLKKDKFVYEWKPIVSFSKKFVFDAGQTSQALFDRANELMSHLQKGLIERRKAEKERRGSNIHAASSAVEQEESM